MDTLYKDIISDSYSRKEEQSCVIEILYIIEAKLVFKVDCYSSKMQILIHRITTNKISKKYTENKLDNHNSTLEQINTR